MSLKLSDPEYEAVLKLDGPAIAAFPTPANRGPVVEPSQMREDLETELSRYE